MKTYIFKAGQTPLPRIRKITRLLLKLNAIPVVRHIGFIKKALYKAFNFPLSTSINPGFFCSTSNLIVGENVSLADTFILASAPVTIGNNCSFSYRNMLITASHDFNDFSTIISKPITIGNNVWITTNVTILQGVTIGDNTVIGAGSIVTKDIPANVFASGNPCVVVKKIRFVK